jgi:hypothetical protein
MKKIIAGYIQYFSYVVRHRRYVRKACFSMGLYYQGIVHDLSKFRLSEAKRYMRWFSLSNKSIEKEFNMAWNHHIKRNKHHRQYRVLIEDSGAIKPIQMPKRYVEEMLCDWWGVGRAFAKTKEELMRYDYCPRSEVYNWYHKNKDNMKLHEKTRRHVEIFLLDQKKIDWIDSGAN